MRRIPFLLLAAGLLACPSPEKLPTGDGVVYGFITDGASGARLEGVSVDLQGHEATTNAKGEFTLEGMPEGDQVLRIRHEGYAPTFANLSVAKEGPTGAVVTLKKEGARQAFTHSKGGTLYQLTEAGPYAVTLTADSLDTRDSNLRVAVTPVDPTKELPVLPGRLETENAMLVPLTFADFTIYDGSGKPVNLKAGKEAVVELPIPVDLRGLEQYGMGETIHCYSYNPATGRWEDFVVGTVVTSSIDGHTPVVRASLKHFSWYGAAPETDDCVDTVVRVVGQDGKPLEGYTVEAFPGGKAVTGADGTATVLSASGPRTRFVATRTYIDTDGSVSGMPGAKVIDIGQIDLELTGLVLKSCRGGGQGLSSVAAADGALGTSGNPVRVQVGPAGLVGYTVVAFLSDSGGAGSALVVLSEALPEGASGDPVDGAVVTLEERASTGPGQAPAVQTFSMTGYGQGSGMYTASLTVKPGARYTLRIDADGNGSVDGTGSVVAPGEVSWESPTDGATLSASSFEARWHSAVGDGAGVTYWVNIQPEDDTTDPMNFSHYSGTATRFTPYRFDWLNPTQSTQRLAPGRYHASVSAFAGPWPMLGVNFSENFTLTNNITGATLGGQFYATGGSAEVTFTLTP